MTQICASEIGTTQINGAKISMAQPGMRQLRSAKERSVEARILQIGFR